MTSFYSLVLFFFASVVLLYFDPKRWHGLLTVFFGLLIAFIDLQSSDVSFSILLLISLGFFLGFTKTSSSFRTGILLGVWLPVAAMIHQIVLGDKSTFFSEGVVAFVALVPSIAGSYLGASVRKHSQGVADSPEPIA